MKRAHVLALACALTAGAVALPAHADDKATADVLFNDGVKLMQAGSFTEACPKLADSQRLDPGIGTALYLGECWEKTQKYASAWGSFREAESLAQRDGDKRLDTAKKRAATLEPRLSKLTLRAPDGADLAQVEITRNGEKVVRSAVGAALPVDGGTYVLTTKAPGRREWQTTVTVPAEKGNVVATLQLGEPEGGAPPVPAATAATATVPAAATADTAEPKGTYFTPLRITGVVVGGLGLVGLVAGIGTGISASSTLNQSNTSNGAAPPPCDAQNFCTQEGLDLRASAKGAADASTALFIVGGVLLATGTALFIFAPRGKAERAAIVPSAAPGAAGLSVVGRF